MYDFEVNTPCLIFCRIKSDMTFDPYDIAVGKRLRQAREAKGLTRNEIAERLNLSLATIQMHETGRNGVKAHQLAVYCKAYQVRAGWVLEGTGEMRDSANEVTDLLRRMKTDGDKEAWIALGRRLARGEDQ